MKRRTLVRLGIAVAIGLAEPYLEVAWRCRAGFEMSEACVWGRSFLSFTRIVAPVLIIPSVFLLLLLLENGWKFLRSSRRG